MTSSQRRARLVAITGLIALVFWGCSDEGGMPASTADVTLAAAVRQPIERVDRFIELDEPLYRLGGAAAPEEEAFGLLRGIELDSRDRLWVGDIMASQISRFGSDGAFLDRVGRKGEGPGEYLQLEVIGLAGEGAVVLDQEQDRVTEVDANGELVGSHRIPPYWEEVPRIVLGYSPPSAFVFTPVDNFMSEPPKGPAWLSTGEYRVVRETYGDTVTDQVLLQVPGLVQYWDGSDWHRSPLNPFPRVAVSAVGVGVAGLLEADLVFAPPDGSEIVAYDMDGPGLELGPELLDAFRSYVRASESSLIASLDLIQDAGLPERVAEFDRVTASNEGVFWLRRMGDTWAGDEARWEVVTASGTHLGTAVLPSSEVIVAASDDRVVTRLRDDYGADVLSVYALPAWVAQGQPHE